MYPTFNPKFASDDEMREVLAKGKKIVTRDKNIEITAYLYNELLYMQDIKKINQE